MEDSIMANVKRVPEGYTTVTPSITVNDAAKAIDFYTKALGATERDRFKGPDGKIMHAEIQIGTARVMLCDEVMGMRAPQSYGGSPVAFYLYVEDADAAFKKATAAGCKSTMPVTDMFWGDRTGQVEDPFGYKWTLATHTKDMTPDEMRRAGEAWMKEMAGST
jgi:uncharacterized glyoxalase superfamily protein PhnB